jgi:hypothetical protein
MHIGIIDKQIIQKSGDFGSSVSEPQARVHRATCSRYEITEADLRNSCHGFDKRIGRQAEILTTICCLEVLVAILYL